MSEGWDLTRDLPKVTRVEVIDGTGRAYMAHHLEEVSMALQDEGRTLKVFVDKENTSSRKIIEQIVEVHQSAEYYGGRTCCRVCYDNNPYQPGGPQRQEFPCETLRIILGAK